MLPLMSLPPPPQPPQIQSKVGLSTSAILSCTMYLLWQTLTPITKEVIFLLVLGMEQLDLAT